MVKPSTNGIVSVLFNLHLFFFLLKSLLGGGDGGGNNDDVGEGVGDFFFAKKKSCQPLF